MSFLFLIKAAVPLLEATISFLQVAINVARALTAHTSVAALS